MWPSVRRIFPGSHVGKGLSRQRSMRERQGGGQSLMGGGNETESTYEKLKCISRKLIGDAVGERWRTVSERTGHWDATLETRRNHGLSLRG